MEEHVLYAHELYRFYHTGDAETMALRGVSMYIAAGETVVVMGPSGSGKSTLLNCLAGLDEPDGGYVSFLGHRVTRRPEGERAAMRATGLGILLQSGNLFPHLTVSENIQFKMHLAHTVNRDRLLELLQAVGLADRQHALPGQLSGGEAARAGLAVALSASPVLLIADEPTGEVDAATEAQILHLFANYRDAGGSLLIATHSDAVAAQADRLLRMHDGKLSHE